LIFKTAGRMLRVLTFKKLHSTIRLVISFTSASSIDRERLPLRRAVPFRSRSAGLSKNEGIPMIQTT
jgi:hypothetical protein